MKKVFFVFFSCFLSFCFVKANEKEYGFEDTRGTKYRNAIEYLHEEEIVQGYEDSSFKPENKISRAEFLAIILESMEGDGAFDFKFEVKNCEFKKEFPDVKKDDWFYPHVCFAEKVDIIDGYPDGTFKPNNEINFAESAVIITSALNVKTENKNGEWYEPAVDALKKIKVVPSDIDSISKNINRGEMAEIAWGILTGNQSFDEEKVVADISSCDDLIFELDRFKEKNETRNKNYKYSTGFDDDIIMEDAEESDGGVFENFAGAVQDAVSRSDNSVVEKESKSLSLSVPEKSKGDYSKTNVQEFGVDEADIIKNDGSHIFLIKGNTIRIVQAVPAKELEEVGKIEIKENNFYPMEMYLDGDTLTVIGRGNIEKVSSKNGPLTSKKIASEKMMMTMPYYGGDSGEISTVIFDVSDRSNPKEKKTVSFEGNYNSSRKINDIVYIVANKYNNIYNIDRIKTDDFLPKFNDSKLGEEEFCNCTDVKYFPNFQDSSFLLIVAIDTKNIEKPSKRKAILGAGNQIYSSTKNLYVTKVGYDDILEIEKNGNEVWNNGQITDIYKISLDGLDMKFVAKGKATGRPLNQFSMSEYDGHFRIATQKGRAWNTNELSSTQVQIFDKDMKKTGEVLDIAPGENMKSARFMGKKAYLVTFKTVDPLFVLDLNPKNPKVLGKLKIPGWSDYLHPYDENHLIGFGKEVDESIDADKVHSDNAIYYTAVLGMKISIFDVSDVSNPKEIHKKVIGARGTNSEILHNHKALLFDKEKGILGFPITVTENKNGKTGQDADIQTVFSGAHIYNIDLENGFSLRGKVSHYDENSDAFIKSGEYFYGDVAFNISRIIYIGEYFYSISQNMIKAMEWDELGVVDNLEIK